MAMIWNGESFGLDNTRSDDVVVDHVG